MTAFSMLALALSGPLTARASDEPDDDETEAHPASSLGLGVAAFSAQKAYRGMKRENRIWPVIYYENRWVRVFGPGAQFKLQTIDIGNSQKIDLGLETKYEGGYKASDASILSGMADRKWGLWAGPKVTWHNALFDVSGAWLTDVSGHSKGQHAELSLEKTWHLGQHVILEPRLEASWLNGKYVNYYYGVRDDEVLSDRPAYVGKAALNTELGGRATYLFGASQAVFLDAGVTRLAKEIRDSPLTGHSTENRVALGYMYRF